MEWIDYLNAVAYRKEPVDGIDGDKPLSKEEKNALLVVLPTQYEILTFSQAEQTLRQAEQPIEKSRKTLSTQFQSIYNKFIIEPATPQELAKRLRIGFDKLSKEDSQQNQSQIDLLDRYDTSIVDTEDEQNQLRKNLQIGQAIYQSSIIFASVKDLRSIEIDGALHNESSILNLLKQKLSLDFKSSFILNEKMFHDELFLLKKRTIRNPNIYAEIRDYFEIVERWDFSSIANSIQGEDLNLLSDIEISVSISSINVGAMATLTSLNNRFKKRFDLNINIDYSSINGMQQIKRINKNRNPKHDFLINPFDDFALCPGNGTVSYRSLGPVNSHTQSVFRKKNSASTRKGCVWTFDKSAGVMQYKLDIGMPKNSKMEIFPDDENILDVLFNMDKGDYIIAWEPFSSILRSSKKFEEIPESKYEIVFHLFACDYWCDPDYDRQRLAFKRLFQNEWKYCQQHQREILEVLRKDVLYLENFAKGSSLSSPSILFKQYNW